MLNLVKHLVKIFKQVNTSNNIIRLFNICSYRFFPIYLLFVVNYKRFCEELLPKRFRVECCQAVLQNTLIKSEGKNKAEKKKTTLKYRIMMKFSLTKILQIWRNI